MTEAKAKSTLKNITDSDLTLAQSCARVCVGLSSYHRRIEPYSEILEAI
jgi:hypothetical protein